MLSIICRKKDESQETDFRDAVAICLPIINAAIRDIEKETFPKNCFLNIEIPSSPLNNKVCKFHHELDNLLKHFVALKLLYG